MKDLNQFIEEKAKQAKKEKPLKRKQGADDAVFLELMGKYKQARRRKDKNADKYLQDARQVKKEGDVSADAKLAAAYI